MEMAFLALWVRTTMRWMPVWPSLASVASVTVHRFARSARGVSSDGGERLRPPTEGAEPGVGRRGGPPLATEPGREQCARRGSGGGRQGTVVVFGGAGIERWLGPLSGLPPGQANPIMQTLHAWLECGSTVEAARRMGAHRQTVRSRMRAGRGALRSVPAGPPAAVSSWNSFCAEAISWAT
ncbi:helix-turn-helix domain-containing protein [Streptomyces sp. NPDC058989]|uniref:helix-turn-helix domain-containing protein n=1 Tax=Streptomyces sp. NPDC058989 TaxID=3346686 RepID=UPI0036940C9F